MKKLIIASVFLLITIFVKNVGGVNVDINTLTLIGMGLALFVAFSFAELGKGLGFPLVTGFIITGLALGPEIGNLLSIDVVSRLKMFNTLAIGIIALSAGLELYLKNIQRDLKSLFTTITGKILLLALFVGPTIYFYETITQQLSLEYNQIIVMALLFSVFSIGTSPSITLAVLSETKAKGRISDLVLSNAILKDFVVVVFVAIAVGFSTSLLSGEKISTEAIVNLVGREIGLSLFVGLITGGVIYLYLKYVNFEKLLFFISLILVVAEISQIFHLEFLLVLIAAGALIRNTTTMGDELHHLLEKVSLPVFIIFFTNAGASIQIGKTISILPLALLIVLARIIALYIASRVSSNITEEKENIKKNIWLGYIPQAGVTLGLIEIVAQKIPTLSSQIYLLGLGVVSINLLLGPITFKLALKKAGEIPEIIPDEDPLTHSKNIAEQPSNLYLIPQFKINLPETFLTLEQLEMKQIVLEAHPNIQEQVDTFIKEYQKSYSLSLELFISQMQLFSSSFYYYLNDEEAKTQLSHLEHARNIHNFTNVISVNIERLALELKENLKKHISKVPARITVKTTQKNFWRQEIEINQELPLQGIIKSQAQVILIQSIAKSTDSIIKILGNSIRNFFEDNIDHCFKTVYNETHDYMTHELISALQEVASKTPPLILKHLNGNNTKNQALSLTNLALTKEINQLNKTLTLGENYFNALSNQYCFKKNLSFSKEKISGAIKNDFHEYIAETHQSIKDASASVFITLEKFKNAIENLKQDSDLSELEDITFTELDLNLNPYILESKFRADLKYFHETIEDIESLFEKDHQPIISELDEIMIKSVDFTSSLRQIEILDILPKLEKDVEELFEYFKNVQLAYIESIGNLKTIQHAQKEIKLENQKLYITQIEEIKRDYSLELSTLSSVIHHFHYQCSVIIANAFASLEYRVFQGKFKTGTVTKVGFIFKYLHRFSQAIIPTMSRIIKAIGTSIIQQTYAIHSPEKLINKRIRKRVVNNDFKRKIDLLLSYPNSLKNKDINDFYYECFSLSPIRSSSNMIFNKDILERVLSVEQDWHKTGKLRFIVISGDSGSGKTSLLNVLQNELETSDITRVNDDYDDKKMGLTPIINSLLRSNRNSKKVVLCDNIDHWVKKSDHAEKDFLNFVNIMLSKRDRSILWICTLSSINSKFLNSTYNLDLLASRTYHIARPNVQDLLEIFEHRQRQSGQILKFNSRFNFSIIPDHIRLKKITTQISHSSHNIRAALSAWLRMTEFSNEGQTQIQENLFTNPKEFMNFTSYLSAEVYVVMKYFFHFGESSINEIARNLLFENEQVYRSLNYLSNLGIILYSHNTHRYDIHHVVKSLIENSIGHNSSTFNGYIDESH